MNPTSAPSAQRPAFIAFVPACKAHDMSKTTGYALVKRGLLNVIRIGRRTYIDPDEFRSLPDRLAKEGA